MCRDDDRSGNSREFGMASLLRYAEEGRGRFHLRPHPSPAGSSGGSVGATTAHAPDDVPPERSSWSCAWWFSSRTCPRSCTLAIRRQRAASKTDGFEAVRPVHTLLSWRRWRGGLRTKNRTLEYTARRWCSFQLSNIINK